MDYSYLLPFCTTAKQTELVEACQAAGSPTKAAKALGLDDSNCRRSIRHLKTRAAKSGVSPAEGVNHPTPEGFAVKGVSTLYNKDGDVSAQWVKTTADSERQAAAMEAMILAMKEDLEPYPRTTYKGVSCDRLANQYLITDFHLGMYAWGEESGEDWDLKKAENLLVRWFERAINLAPDASIGIFAQLGDFLHWDGMEAMTPMHGNLLDADTRFQKVIRVCIRVIRRVITMLLEKHVKVHVIQAVGNHDPASSAWLRELLSAMYSDEPRITVDTSPDCYYCYQHGNTTLMYHHGHKRTPANISEVLAAKFKDAVFGSKNVYAHMGHRHHNEVKESALMQIEQHRTLAPKDAYASSGGYMSGRDAKVITYDKEHGEVSRLIISPEMIGD
jgi:hypothetical protein